MSVIPDILRTYRAPREVQRQRMAGPPREDRALAILLVACGLMFVAQWPRLARQAWSDPSIALDALVVGALFGWMMLLPLAFYALALVLHMAKRIIGDPMTGFQVRMSLFWALLASVPLWLLSGLIAGYIGAGSAFSVTSTIALGAVLLFLIAGLTARPAAKDAT